MGIQEFELQPGGEDLQLDTEAVRKPESQEVFEAAEEMSAESANEFLSGMGEDTVSDAEAQTEQFSVDTSAELAAAAERAGGELKAEDLAEADSLNNEAIMAAETLKQEVSQAVSEAEPAAEPMPEAAPVGEAGEKGKDEERELIDMTNRELNMLKEYQGQVEAKLDELDAAGLTGSAEAMDLTYEYNRLSQRHTETKLSKRLMELEAEMKRGTGTDVSKEIYDVKRSLAEMRGSIDAGRRKYLMDKLVGGKGEEGIDDEIARLQQEEEDEWEVYSSLQGTEDEMQGFISLEKQYEAQSQRSFLESVKNSPQLLEQIKSERLKAVSEAEPAAEPMPEAASVDVPDVSEPSGADILGEDYMRQLEADLEAKSGEEEAEAELLRRGEAPIETPAADVAAAEAENDEEGAVDVEPVQAPEGEDESDVPSGESENEPVAEAPAAEAVPKESAEEKSEDAEEAAETAAEKMNKQAFSEAMRSIDDSADIPDEWKAKLKEVVIQAQDGKLVAKTNLEGNIRGVRLVDVARPDLGKSEKEAQAAEEELRYAQYLVRDAAGVPGSKAWVDSLPGTLRQKYLAEPPVSWDKMGEKDKRYVKMTKDMLPDLEAAAKRKKEAHDSLSKDISKDKKFSAAGDAWSKIKKTLLSKIKEKS